jgi:hypothetical protein
VATNSGDVALLDTEFDAAKAMLRDLFGIMGIQNVVVVDDQLSTPLDVERIIGAIRARAALTEGSIDLKIPELAGIDVSAPVDVWRGQVEAAWTRVAIERKDAIGRELGIKEEEKSNESARHVIERILGDVPADFLSLTEWQQKKAALIAAAKQGTTLFLFDLDMRENSGRQDEGMRIIAELLREHIRQGPVYFGLISNNVGVNEEYQQHLQFMKDYELEDMGDRFAVISKKGLDAHPREFAFRLKRVAISPRCAALKTGIFSALEKAMTEAKAKVEGLHIYDFERIVFRSSYNEGVWEVDTLLRLFSAFFRESARANASTDPVIRKAADDVRRVVSFPYRPDDAPEAKVQGVARLEMYETADYLCIHRIPIEVGDIFQKTEGKQQYMLLEQPCDLMVRGGDKNKGKRLVELVTLAEIFYVKTENRPPNAATKLEYYSEEAGKEAYVRLEKCHTVPVSILDLCVCSDTGAAQMQLGARCPDGMIPAWQERYRILQKTKEEELARYQGLVQPKGKEAPALTRAIEAMLQETVLHSVPGVVTGKINFADKRIEYNLKRVGKLKQPWSGGVLRDYAYHKARDAFDHDWTRTEEQ